MVFEQPSLEQLRRLPKLALAEKLQWLEEAQRIESRSTSVGERKIEAQFKPRIDTAFYE